MKIVYLSASEVPSRTADSIHVMKMCEAFAKNGHQTTLIGRRFDHNQTKDAYDYYDVDRNFELVLMPSKRIKGIGIILLRKLYGRLKAYNPKDVLIYARDIYGAFLAIRMGYRLIYESHGLPYNKLIYYLECGLLKCTRLLKLVVISQALKSLYTSKLAIRCQIEVCHDAANVPDLYDEGEYSWPSERETLQVGYTGHLYKGRGIEIIIECAKRLPQYDFHVVGGTDIDIAYWKAYPTDNIYFHGFVEPGIIHHIRSKCDVLLMPYQTDLIIPYSNVNTTSWMSPMKLFEYMASSRAIIASDLPVLREVLDEEKAVLVKPDCPDEWVDAIRRCEDRQYRESLARNAYESFLKYYTWEKRAKSVLKGIKL